MSRPSPSTYCMGCLMNYFSEFISNKLGAQLIGHIMGINKDLRNDSINQNTYSGSEKGHFGIKNLAQLSFWQIRWYKTRSLDSQDRADLLLKSIPNPLNRFKRQFIWGSCPGQTPAVAKENRKNLTRNFFTKLFSSKCKWELETTTTRPFSVYSSFRALWRSPKKSASLVKKWLFKKAR